MKSRDFLDWIGCGFATVFTAVQTQEVFQIVSLILTCVATGLTIAYTIYKWYKNAMQDKKLDENEIKEGIEILKDAGEQIKDIVDKTKKK